MNKFTQKLFYFVGLLVFTQVVACSGGGGGGDSSADTRPLGSSIYYPSTLAGDNVIPLSVGACGVDGYENEPCISVTICATADNTNCQTISNILVDTGSYGLKIFNSLITVPLDQVTAANGGELANCTAYLDGSGHWGPVKKAWVKMGNLMTTEAIPIVAMSGTYADPSACSTDPSKIDKTPADAGFNGIIGVGAFAEDCSLSSSGVNACLANSSNGTYYSCSGTSCSGSVAAAAKQIINPVAKMPSDYNNGIVIKLPDVDATGAGAVYGYMILGIGTSGDANNQAGSGVTAFGVSNLGLFITNYSSTNYSYAFIDSGTNFMAFPQKNSAPALCSSSVFYCPSSTVTLSATMKGVDSTGSANGVTQAVSFDIGNMVTLASGDVRNMVYNNVGFTLSGKFDWGLPFFLGRTVYVGIKGTSATVNGSTVNGPFWAF